MKKSILILAVAITTVCLTAFAFYDRPYEQQTEIIALAEVDASSNYGPIGPMMEYMPEDFLVKVESRFMTTVTKEELNNANTIFDIFPPEAVNGVAQYDLVEISIEKEEPLNKKEIGTKVEFNEAQRNLLASLDYSTDFYLRTNIKRKNKYTGELSYDYIVYYMTVVPEKQAEYSDGLNALAEYLKQKAFEDKIFIDKYALKPGRLDFTVTKTGDISDVYLDSSSGYSEMDERLEVLLNELPGTWTPAENANGEPVNQKLVLFFGIQGC